MIRETVEKKYWTIGEVCRKHDVAPSKIRFWLDEFGLDEGIKRDHRFQRMFTQKDKDDIDEIYYLVEVKKFRIEGAKHEFKERRKTRKRSVLGEILPEQAPERTIPLHQAQVEKVQGD